MLVVTQHFVFGLSILSWFLVLVCSLRDVWLYRDTAPVWKIMAGIGLASGGVIAASISTLGGWSESVTTVSDLSVSGALLVAGAFFLYLLARKGMGKGLGEVAATKQSFQEQENILQALSATAYEGIYLVDPEQMVYVASNPSGAAALQYSAEEMKGLSLGAVHPGNTELIRSQLQRAQDGEGCVRFSCEAQQKNGGRLLVELSCSRVEQGGKTLVLAVGRDLTRWQESSRKLHQLNQLYALLSQSNRAITHIHEQQALFERICEIAVREGEFRVAWIGEVRGRELVPVAHAGQAQGYVEAIEIRLDDAELRNGPMGRSILDRRVAFANDIETDASFRAWRDVARKNGIRAVATVPLFLRDQPYGAFAICSAHPNAFDGKLADLLSSLGADLSYAITQIENEKDRQRSRSQLSKLSQVVEQSADAVMIVSHEGLIEYVNPRFSELTGYSLDEVLGRQAGFLCASDSELIKYRSVIADIWKGCSWKGDFRNRTKSGDLYWSLDTISPICDEAGNVTHFVSTSEDYTELRKAQETIEQLAFYDPLTELPNRRLLHDRARQAVEAARRNKTQVALMFLDLDKFKSVNDSMGHPAGDRLLKEVSRRLEDSIRPQDTVARLGGDEFTVLLTGINELSDVVQVAERILEHIQVPIEIKGQMVSVTTSLGITLFPDDGDDLHDLLRNADLAMYHAKSLGRNNFQFYTEEINRQALGQLDLERQLKLAIENESFVLHYQPQIDLFTGQVVGVEALVRWVNERGEMVPPDVFIPLAEETGLIEPIGAWVLKRALQEMKQISLETGFAVKVAVNLSAIQFRRADRLKQMIREQLEETGVEPSLLELELTESMLVDDVQVTIETLHELRKLGVSLAIDDFGIGYSSLNYLKRFPIDILKIDRSFVRDIETNPSDAAITAAIVALGHELDLKVVAEGVENETQLKFLQQHECDFYQGYFFSPPVPLERLRGLIRQGPIGLVPAKRITGA